MKKLFVLSLLTAGMTFVSCGADDPESKAQELVEDFLDAKENHDFEKMIEIEKEAKAYSETLSDEDCKIFQKVVNKGLFEK